MVREIKEPKLSGKLKKLASSSFFIPVVLLFFFVLTIPVISLFTSHQQDIRQHAAGAGPTASINTTPLSGNVTVGQTFTVDVVVDGGGQSFNAAQANVAASSNLTIQSVTLTPPTSGGCNFTYVNQGSTPSIAHPSFVGAILNGASTKCTAYTITLVGNASGTGNVTITSGSVKSSVDHSEIFLSSGNGLFTIGTTKVNPLAQSVMSLSPSTGSVVSGQSIVVDVRINTNGETVNGVQTNITYPPSLLSVASINSSSGVFDVKAQQTDDGNGNIALGFGAFTPQNGSNLLVATITFVSKAQGSANVNFANSSVISDISNQDVLKNVINGTYIVVGSTLTPTPTTPITNPTPTSVPNNPTPTSVPNQPTSTPAPTSVPTTVPTSIPTTVPTSVPTATPTPVSSPTLTITSLPLDTYKTSVLLWGTKSTNTTSVSVNNSTTGLSYPSSSTWQVQVQLAMGINTFSVFGQDSNGNKSVSLTTSIKVHEVGDISGDGLVDLTDLSMFGTDWANIGTLNYVLSDMNGDGIIDLTDFSILASAYGN